MTPTEIWEEMQKRLPFHDDVGYREMSVDDWTMSQCFHQLRRRHSQATDSVPDSPERVADWQEYFKPETGHWWVKHYPHVQGSRWESQALVYLGELCKSWGDDAAAEGYWILSVKRGHRGQSDGAQQALIQLQEAGHEDPFAAAGV